MSFDAALLGEEFALPKQRIGILPRKFFKAGHDRERVLLSGGCRVFQCNLVSSPALARKGERI
jgi:hypothetical protein